MDTETYQEYIRSFFQQNLPLRKKLEKQILPNVSGAESIALGQHIIVRQYSAATGETVITGEWSTIGGKTINTGLFTVSARIKNQVAETAKLSDVQLLDLTFL